MIREVTMYAAVCDDCGITPFDEGSDYAAWTDRLGALAEAEGSDWANPDGDVLYCSTCAAKRSVAEEEAEEAAEDQAAPTVWHVGRSWEGMANHLEDACPCPKEPCGLVVLANAHPDCEEHPVERAKSMRQGHPADKCPGVVAGHA